jgi:protein gp37
MADGTGIEWTDATWNPTVGCTKVSPGCDHCYAETFVSRFAGSKGFPLPFDQMLLRGERFLNLPRTWRTPRKVFVNSLSDLFHADVPDEFIGEVFAVMASCPQHTFQLLTKRHGRMRSLLSSPRWPEILVGRAHWPRDIDPEQPLPNVWLGVSVEDQQWANVRVPALLETPAAVRWISAEPLLGPVDLEQTPTRFHTTPLDWVVVGGESGPGARPMDVDWARLLRDQCQSLGIPYLFKQWGSHDANGVPTPKKVAGRVLDGVTHDGYPQSPSEVPA